MRLHRGDVLSGALDLLDDEGLDNLTMRKLATRLGVQAGALYWHFANKQALLDAIAEQIIDGVGDPLPDLSWDRQLALLAGRLRQALLSRRDGAQVVAGTFVTDANTMMAGTALITVLCAAGVRPERAGWTAFAVEHYVLGHTIEEQAQLELIDDDATAKEAALLAGASSEASAIAIRAVLDSAPQERFEYGLSLLLDGIRTHLDESAEQSR